MRLFSTIARTRYLFAKVFPLMRDARVPLAFKAGTVLTAALIVSPLDLFGDIPVLGWMDDAVLLTLLATAFVAIGSWLARRAGVPAYAPVTVNARPVSRPMLRG
jgi:uncharacterized membrane protein YkvA (DUF1232 family)